AEPAERHGQHTCRSRRPVAAAAAPGGIRTAGHRSGNARTVRPQSRIIALALTLALAAPQPVLAYLKFGVRVGGQSVTLKWAQTPVRYFVSSRNSVPGVGIGDFEAAVARAFATWQAVPTSAISYD